MTIIGILALGAWIVGAGIVAICCLAAGKKNHEACKAEDDQNRHD